MNCNITELLNKPDNVEVIRDQIAAILKVELSGQYDKALGIATENSEIDPLDYKIGVWIEKERAWQLTEDSEGSNPFPLVNICLLGYRPDSPAGGAVGQKRYIADYTIDCYAKGAATDPLNSDDTDATIRAWQVGRIIRNILMSGPYTYLGMRGIVREREIIDAKIGDPGNLDESAVSVRICRFILSVKTYEDSPQSAGVEFAGMSFTSSSPNGEVLFSI